MKTEIGNRNNALRQLAMERLEKTKDSVSMAGEVMRANGSFDTPLPMEEVKQLIESCHRTWLIEDSLK